MSAILCRYRALAAHLLYRFERPQYAEILRQYAYGPDVPVEQVKTNSKLYGAEHLLRLLGKTPFLFLYTLLIEILPVSLPTLVASASMDASSMNIIREYSNYLLE